ncbi:hypothetical protein N0V90_012443 [Kalmusia sp. IMI 367209]|nr:hypothetical protein N0V90_012443 [Kalmusia sp. IMI 367209]
MASRYATRPHREEDYYAPRRRRHREEDYFSDSRHNRRPAPRDRHRERDAPRKREDEGEREERHRAPKREERKWQREGKKLFNEYAVPAIKAEGTKYISKQIGNLIARGVAS